MKRFALLTATLFLFAMSMAACKKTEPPPPPPPMPAQGMPGQPGGMPGQPAGMPGQPGGNPALPGGMPPMGSGPEKKVTIPDSVKGSWKTVKIEIDFKEKKSRKQFSIPLRSEFKVPDSDLTIKIGEFLPHFAMTAESITSNSNNPENPAVQIGIQQGGKEIFRGWLFSKFPAVHPFQHDKYGVTLLEGSKK